MIKMKENAILLALALALLLLVACGAGEEAGPEPDQEPAPTEAAEAAPTKPAPTTEAPQPDSTGDEMESGADSELASSPQDEEEVELREPEEGEAMGTVLAEDGVFVRTGPSSGYPALGAAHFEATGIITGKSEDGEWWVVEVPVSEMAPDGQGWVAAEFVEADNSEDVPVVEGPTKLESLQLVPWQWFSLTEPAGVTAVNDPESYTLTFSDDGTVDILADCNMVTAEYTADETEMSIEQGASTMAACPEGSSDQLFLASLAEVVFYRFEGGDLYLDLDAGQGIMRFKKLLPQ